MNVPFEYICQDGEPARHVAIQRAVADGQFAFVACRQCQPAVAVAANHHQGTADAGLQVLVCQSRRLRCQIGPGNRGRFVRGMNGVDGDDFEIDTQCCGQLPCIRDAVFAAVPARQRSPCTCCGPAAAAAM